MKSLVVLFDPDNDAPLRRAVSWLNADGALHLVGVLRQPSHLAHSLWPQSSALLAVDLARAMDQALDALDLPPTIHRSSHVAEGDPAPALSKIAADAQADAVIMDGAAMTAWRSLFAPQTVRHVLLDGRNPLILVP